MTLTETYTETYTVADIRNVFEQVGSQLAMISRSTQLWTVERTNQVIEDLTAFASREYLSQIDLVLRAADEADLRALTWTPSYSAGAWTSDAPSGNIWPRTPDGSLHIVIHYSAKWTKLTVLQEANFRSKLRRPWSTSSIDTSFPELTAVETNHYASREYGVQRLSRERRL